MHIKGRPTNKTIGKNILEIQGNNRIGVADCKAEAYDGAKIMSSEVSVAAAFTKKKQQPLAKYNHCCNHFV